MKLCGACGIVFIALLMNVHAEPSQAEEISVERVLRNFELVAFGTEEDPDSSAYVRKWVSDIDVYFQNESGILLDNFLDGLLDELALLTGLEFHRESDPKRSRFWIFITQDEQEFRDFARQSGSGYTSETARCVAVIAGEGATIDGAIVAMPANLTESQLQSCLVEEISQALGPLNDSYEAVPSIFNDDGVYERLTISDRALIRILYDPQLTPGLPRQQALDIAATIVPQILAQHRNRQSRDDVRTRGDGKR